MWLYPGDNPLAEASSGRRTRRLVSHQHSWASRRFRVCSRSPSPVRGRAAQTAVGSRSQPRHMRVRGVTASLEHLWWFRMRTCTSSCGILFRWATQTSGANAICSCSCVKLCTRRKADQCMTESGAGKPGWSLFWSSLPILTKPLKHLIGSPSWRRWHLC